ncbi:MAG: hypothetical protein JNM68_13515 [Dinghuibacter sp.]|nr:hypothetical protein [Dinghuibacter sp.]
MNDIEVILKALTREREDLHQQLMQVDRIINRVKSGTYSGGELPDKPIQLQVEAAPPKVRQLSPAVDIKVQILRVFDVLGVASTLKQLQTEYKEMTGSNYNIREPVRSLNKSTLIKLVKDKTLTRGFMWVKADWIENGQLLDKHKPEGFDLLYKPENLIYE